MPHYVADKVGLALNSQRKAVNGASILVLGIAYKRDIDDIRESPALDVMHVLQQRGGIVGYADPHVPTLRARDWPGGIELRSVDLTRDEIANHDCVVILTDHRAFDYEMVAGTAKLLLDTRNALGARDADHIFRLGAPTRHAPDTVTQEVAA
jgi:UDP-N-acetyl-D-glucosamine dehydrogenase